MNMQKSRPDSVKIVIILSFINGIILGVTGILASYSIASIISPIISSEFDTISNLTDAKDLELTAETRSMIKNTIIDIIYAVAFISIALGIAWFGLAWGLFSSKMWSWVPTVILAIITLVFSVVTIVSIVNVATLIISGIIIYYMYRPQVKSYFGRLSIPR